MTGAPPRASTGGSTDDGTRPGRQDYGPATHIDGDAGGGSRGTGARPSALSRGGRTCEPFRALAPQPGAERGTPEEGERGPGGGGGQPHRAPVGRGLRGGQGGVGVVGRALAA